MAQTDPKTFGDDVITNMGAADEFTTAPLVEAALRFGAAWVYARYLAGEYGSIVTPIATGQFVAVATNFVANNVLEGVPELAAVSWPGRATFRTAFESALTTSFDTYKT